MSDSNSPKTTYRDSGVDVELADKLIRSWLPEISRTSRSGQIGSPLGFGGLFEIPPGFDHPVLVSGTDGVGTKLKIAFEMNRHDTVGIDLVAMCVNDVIVHGAEPLFFLDYIATGKLDESVLKQVIAGIVKGCEIAETALIGGETAEMPGMYSSGEFDLAGFTVGIVEKSQIIDGNQVSVGDAIIGLESSGVHSNGFSLIRKLIEDSGQSLSTDIGGTPLGDVLLTPTRIYVQPVLEIIQTGQIHALAHITGGGLPGNIERVMPQGLSAVLDAQSWPRQPVFEWIQNTSQLRDEEILKTFNCGVGMAVIIPRQAETVIRNKLDSMEIPSYRIGAVEESQNSGTVIE